MILDKIQFSKKVLYLLLVFIVTLGLLLIVGCAGKQIPPQFYAYDCRVMSQATTFTAPNEKAEEAWSRAHQFIATLSSFRIQTATDYVIQTYMSDSSWPKYGYSVTRTTSNSTNTFIVKCYCSNMFRADRAKYNAHALAHYMVTGEVIDQRINR